MRKNILRFGGWVAAFLAACAIAVAGSRPVADTGMGAGARTARVITDPATGRRWLLERDPLHPGGPGKLVEEAVPRADGAEDRMPVIRTGERVLVEENTAVARALLEGVALSSARRGSTFRVRLTAGGHVVRAMAVGRGRAVLAGWGEAGQ